MKKYALVFAIVVIAVALDQWTKVVASDALASHRAGHFSHYIELTVGPEFDGKTVKEFITHEFGERNTPGEINDILRGVTTDGAVLLFPSQTLSSGDKLEVRRRTITVIDGYWDYEYTRNTGAAFSLLADTDSPWRKPFFVIVALLAVCIILWILRGVEFNQQILIWGLALIMGGAIGNLLDRLQHGYVIDFVVWKYTDAYRWPTFNVADAFICIGVAFMIIEMIRDAVRNSDEDSEPELEAKAS